MCYIITMTMWVKLAVLDSPPFTVIYLASGNLFFIWCLVRINSFNMGEYGVKITVISFVIAEHLCGLPRKYSPFILRVLHESLLSADCFSSACCTVLWNLIVATPFCCHVSSSWVRWSLWRASMGNSRRKREEEILRHKGILENGEPENESRRPQWSLHF